MTAPARVADEKWAEIRAARCMVWISDRWRVQVTGRWRLQGDTIAIRPQPEHARWAQPGPIDHYTEQGRTVAESWRRLGGGDWRALLAKHPTHPRIPALRRLLCRLYGDHLVALAEGGPISIDQVTP